MAVTINFYYVGKCFSFNESELKMELSNIVNGSISGNYTIKKVKDNDMEFILDLIRNWDFRIGRKNIGYFYFKDSCDYYKVKKCLFLYSSNVIDKLIENYNLQILRGFTEEEKRKFKSEVIGYTQKRYNVDRGYIGLIAQHRFLEFLKHRDIKAEPFEHDVNRSDKTDDFDIKVTLLNYKEITLDVKCATRDDYVYITPKIIVEVNKKKDYYIAMKYYESHNIFVVFGYFSHDDLLSYSFEVLYGNPFFGVLIYDTKPIENLLSNFIDN
ncbi:MAG: hypothetical protein QXP36_07330 [Conexivisphaerales archaeon]